MLKTLLLVLLVVIAGSYTLLVSSNSSLSNQEGRCDNKFIESVTHWSSACFYTAFFKQKPTRTQLMEEKKRLDTFAMRGGVAADILWYRMKFHQRFQNEFDTSHQQIHDMYLAYTKAQHTRLDFQVDYLRILNNHALAELGQQTLDEYCKTYIPPKRNDLVEEIKLRITQAKLPYSTKQCEAQLEPNSIPPN